MNADLQKIETGLTNFEQKKQELTDLAKSAEGLKIESINDKKQFLIVSEKRKELKAARVSIEKEAKAMRDIITPISKHISAKEKELIGIIEPIELELKKGEDWYNNEIARIEAEAEAAKRLKIQSRVDNLAAYGVAYDIDALTYMTDDQFDLMLLKAKSEWEAEQARLKAEAEAAEAARLAELERMRVQAEAQEAEAKRLAEIQAKQEAEAAKLAAERKAIEDEKAAALAKIEAEKQRLENERKQAEAIEAAKIEAAKKERERIEYEAQLAKEKAAAEAARIEAKRIADEAEAKRIAELAPDKQKLIEWLESIELPVIHCKSKEAQDIWTNCINQIESILAEATKKANQL